MRNAVLTKPSVDHTHNPQPTKYLVVIWLRGAVGDSLPLREVIMLKLLDFRVGIALLLLTSLPTGVQGLNATSDITMGTITDLSPEQTTTNGDIFPTGDVLNDARFRKIKFVFPSNETILEGMRNAFPYYNWHQEEYDGQVYVYTDMMYTAKEISFDPVLRSKLYCAFHGFPDSREWNYACIHGTHPFFKQLSRNVPLGMLQFNIPLSVVNAFLAFFSLVFGVFGNIFILAVILTRKELKTSTNLILAGISVVDCLNSVMVVGHGYLDTFLWTVTNPVLGPIGCMLLRGIKELSQLVAINHLITLSFERYFAICWPMKTSLRFTQKKIIPILIINWIIAVAQVIPIMMWSFNPENIGLQTDDHQCYFEQQVDSQPPTMSVYYYLIYIFCIYLVLPVPILCFNCVSVVRSLLISVKRSRLMTGETSRQTNAEKARLKLAYMLTTLLIIYIVTVTPGQVTTLLVRLQLIEWDFVVLKIYNGSIDMLRAMNSCMNVIVYSVISRQFRSAFKDVLCSCRRGQAAAN